ncbi:MAG: osmotically inducible protein C [bacterium]|nr:osmotically inducible protein C [bacterium]
MFNNMEITFDGGKVVTAHIGDFEIKTDQSIKDGGEGSAPSPYHLFLASLGTCAGVYIQSFCERRNISTDKIKIIQNVENDSITGLAADIKFDIQLPDDFPDKYRKAMINSAELCKVKKTIDAQPKFEIVTSKK